MAELWEIVLSIVGAGIVGYIIRLIEERRRQTHEREVEYRKELKRHLSDLFEPLFELLGDLWNSLIELTNPDYVEYNNDIVLAKGHKLIARIKEAEETLANLIDFVTKNENKLNLLLPQPLQSWQYWRLESSVNEIIKNARKGKFTFDDISKPVYAIMNIQDDLQKILGFKIKMRLKSEYAFETHLSRFGKLKRKLKSTVSEK